MSSSAIVTDIISASKCAQVVQATINTPSSFATVSAGNWVDVTSYSVVITPSSTKSKIIIFSSISTAPNTSINNFRYTRNGTAIAISTVPLSSQTASTWSSPGNGGSTPTYSRTLSYVFTDSPATTSSITYQLQVSSNASKTVFFNSGTADGTTATNFRATSNIIAMEIV